MALASTSRSFAFSWVTSAALYKSVRTSTFQPRLNSLHASLYLAVSWPAIFLTRSRNAARFMTVACAPKPRSNLCLSTVPSPPPAPPQATGAGKAISAVSQIVCQQSGDATGRFFFALDRFNKNAR